MAADWIKMQKSTSDKPEVWAIADALKIDPDAVVGKLFRVWSWFDEQTENGHAPSVTKKLLDRDVSVSGFCDTMIECGWMVDDGETVSLPNFERHNGESAKKRALSAERKRKQRENVPHDVPEPSRLERDNSVTREEKRREDINTHVETSVSTCPQQKIVDLYHDCCPSLPRVQRLTPARQQAIRARWRNELPTLEDWSRFFAVVSESKFLTGQASPSGGRSKPFLADIDFLTKQANVVKIMEGKYDD